ncbi:unnamed protein product [Linum trigynum]|uniref:Embryo defective n=1 Tax=Linum trigynum TaxID=586398 RepID=A0AAV2GA55_9ROSI
MSMISTIALSAHPTLTSSPFLRLPLQPRSGLNSITFRSLPVKGPPFLGKAGCKRLRLFGDRKLTLEFSVNSQNTEGEINNGVEDDSQKMAREETTMPDRFRYLTKEAPDPPLRWPWFVALGFLIYSWRAVLFELGNWKKGALSVIGFVGYLLKLLLALIFHFIGDPITSLIRTLETGFYMVRAFYSRILHYTPVPEFTTMIVLSSAVLAIAEAAVPNSVSSQSYLLTLSGLIGYAAVGNYISEPLFWTLLLGVYTFSRLVKKRDDVTSALPAATVLTAIGEPWVRVLVMTSYVALAIYHHSKNRTKGEEGEVVARGKQVPAPLLCAGLAIGIKIAAKWAGYRHLTWMVV